MPDRWKCRAHVREVLTSRVKEIAHTGEAGEGTDAAVGESCRRMASDAGPAVVRPWSWPAGERSVNAAPEISPTDAQQLAAEFEGEKPGRSLGGWTARLVDTVAVAVALLVIWQVFAPLGQGSQYYLIWFLAGVLPLIFLAFPAALRVPRWWRRADRADAFRVRGNRPAVLDWVLAVSYTHLTLPTN